MPFTLDKCSTNCNSESDLIGFPCGHPFCSKCAIRSNEPTRSCPKCKQGLRCFAGFLDTNVFYRVYRKSSDDLIPVFEEVDEVEEAKKHEEELKSVQQKYEELKCEVECQICFDKENDIAFQCGHRACSDCAKRITLCHYCRLEIKKRIQIFR